MFTQEEMISVSQVAQGIGLTYTMHSTRQGTYMHKRILAIIHYGQFRSQLIFALDYRRKPAQNMEKHTNSVHTLIQLTHSINSVT